MTCRCGKPTPKHRKWCWACLKRREYAMGPTDPQRWRLEAKYRAQRPIGAM